MICWQCNAALSWDEVEVECHGDSNVSKVVGIYCPECGQLNKLDGSDRVTE